jgi:hypothetical protein
MKELNIDKKMDTMIDLHMEEHVEVDVSITSEEVYDTIKSEMKLGNIQDDENWELTEKMWDELENSFSTEQYTYNQDWYDEDYGSDNVDETRWDIIMDMVHHLTSMTGDGSRKLLSESELIGEEV